MTFPSGFRHGSTTLAAIAAAFLVAACSATADAPSATSGGEAGPAAAADADRTVDIEALDTLAYDPATVAARAGETITFVVTNSGVATHEFVIGDAALQEAHEAEMQGMSDSGMEMGDEPNVLTLAAGETKSITWQFTEAGQLQFACHQPGHYAAGMVGRFDVA